MILKHNSLYIHTYYTQNLHTSLGETEVELTYLEYEAEVVEPLCVLEGRVPLGAGHGETERPQ